LLEVLLLRLFDLLFAAAGNELFVGKFSHTIWFNFMRQQLVAQLEVVIVAQRRLQLTELLAVFLVDLLVEVDPHATLDLSRNLLAHLCRFIPYFGCKLDQFILSAYFLQTLALFSSFCDTEHQRVGEVLTHIFSSFLGRGLLQRRLVVVLTLLLQCFDLIFETLCNCNIV